MSTNPATPAANSPANPRTPPECPECGGRLPWCALQDRIRNCLGNGGLFNPELMEHDKVGELIRDINDAITQTGIAVISKPELNALELGAICRRLGYDAQVERGAGALLDPKRRPEIWRQVSPIIQEQYRDSMRDALAAIGITRPKERKQP